nr:unnamed protein product [Naegleria fowleri]
MCSTMMTTEPFSSTQSNNNHSGGINNGMMMSSNNLSSSLPFYLMDDLLYHIFSYCLLPIVQFRYSLVCKRWYRLTNSEQFHKNYHHYVTEHGHLKQLLDPRSANDCLLNSRLRNERMMKTFLFDWTEFVSHTHPREYEALYRLKKSLHVEDWSLLNDEQFKEKLNSLLSGRMTMKFNSHSLESIQPMLRNCKLVTLDNGLNQSVSFFCERTSHSNEMFYGFVNEKSELVSFQQCNDSSIIDLSHIHNSSQKIHGFLWCSIMYSFYDRGWGDTHEITSKEGDEWFISQFKGHYNILPKPILLSLLDFIAAFPNEREDVNSFIYGLKPHQHDTLQYFPHFKDTLFNHAIQEAATQPLLETATRIEKYLKSDMSTLFERSILFPYKRSTMKNLWYRFMTCGYRLNETSSSLEFTFFVFSFGVDQLEFFIDYCLYLNKRSFCEECLLDNIYKCMKSGLNYCQIIYKKGFQHVFPREVCRLEIFKCDEGNKHFQALNYALIDFFKEIMKDDFFCPFDVRTNCKFYNVSLPSSALENSSSLSQSAESMNGKPPRVLVLHQNKNSMRNFSHFFKTNPYNVHLENSIIEQEFLPKRLIKLKRKWEYLKRFSKYDVVVFCLGDYYSENKLIYCRATLNFLSQIAMSVNDRHSKTIQDTVVENPLTTIDGKQNNHTSNFLNSINDDDDNNLFMNEQPSTTLLINEEPEFRAFPKQTRILLAFNHQSFTEPKILIPKYCSGLPRNEFVKLLYVTQDYPESWNVLNGAIFGDLNEFIYK